MYNRATRLAVAGTIMAMVLLLSSFGCEIEQEADGIAASDCARLIELIVDSQEGGFVRCNAHTQEFDTGAVIGGLCADNPGTWLDLDLRGDAEIRSRGEWNGQPFPLSFTFEEGGSTTTAYLSAEGGGTVTVTIP